VIVVDASVVLDVLLKTARGRAAADVLLARGESLHAPHLIDVEVTQALRRWERLQDLSPARAAEAREDLSQLPLARYGHVDLLPRIWSLRATMTAYDAAYVALAEALDCRLLTFDAKLARAAGPQGPATLLQ
jgi:predicted nucleic acid-binding protein